MAFDVNAQQDKINKLREAYEAGQFADALLAALNTGNGLMQQRVFTLTKDVEGNAFGPYVGKKSTVKKKGLSGQSLTPYQRKRASKGRQVIKKDLELTGGLRRSIETISENNKSAAIEFNTFEAAAIATGQETQITNLRLGKKGTTSGKGIRIFRLNNKEKEEVNEQGRLLINQILQR